MSQQLSILFKKDTSPDTFHHLRHWAVSDEDTHLLQKLASFPALIHWI